MTSTFLNNIKINRIHPDKESEIWFSEISEITQSLLCDKTVYDSSQIKNILFSKDHFSISFLSGDEIDTLNGFKAMKKQIEWMSGRYLIKLMIKYHFFHDLPLEKINLAYLDEGAPFLTCDPDIPFSISHSNNYAVAVCCKNRKKTVGIDIEKITEKTDTLFLKTAFTKKEISYLQDNAASVFRNWTIKEAYLKYIKKGFNESLHNVEIIGNDIWHNKTRIKVNVFSTLISENYILSLVSKGNGHL